MIEDRVYFEFEVKCPMCGKGVHTMNRIINYGVSLYLCDNCLYCMKRDKPDERNRDI